MSFLSNLVNKVTAATNSSGTKAKKFVANKQTSNKTTTKEADNKQNSKTKQESSSKINTKNSFGKATSSYLKTNTKNDKQNIYATKIEQKDNQKNNESIHTATTEADNKTENVKLTKKEEQVAMDEIEKATKEIENDFSTLIKSFSTSTIENGLDFFESNSSEIKLKGNISGTNYTTTINRNTATVIIRGKDGNSNIQITTPFDASKLKDCMDIVGTSGEDNGMQFVQKGVKAYSDQCLGMSAIYGAMLKGESAYFQTENGEWNLTSDKNLKWKNGILKSGKTGINACSDVKRYTKLTFGDEQEPRQDSANNMKDAIIKELDSGNPVIVEVAAIHGEKENARISRHYATAIGYTTDKATGKPKDVVIWDPFTGDCRTLNFSYEENGLSPKDWIKGYDGDRVPIKGKDAGKKSKADNPDAFQIYVWKKDESVAV